MRKIIAGNWKMNGSMDQCLTYGDQLMQHIDLAPDNVEIIICPPLPLVPILAASLEESGVAIGAQDCSPNADGAYTGDISATMVFETGADFVIVGHSERRHGQAHGHFESDEIIRAKAEAALAAGLTPIICVGETKEERETGQAETIVLGQLTTSLPQKGDFIVAYEPVWAIGTGLNATKEDIETMHAFIRQQTKQPILYGGSVKPDNAAGILKAKNVDGVLVGGASLKPEDFLAIIQAAG